MNYFYDMPYCKIFFEEDSGSVVIKWNGFANSLQFREACDKSLDLLKEKRSVFMIADNTEAKAVDPIDQDWMLKTWFPKALSLGYRGSAVILSKSALREIAIKEIVNNLDKNQFQIQYFDNFSNAVSWLKLLK